jgi:hypothetical protein
MDRPPMPIPDRRRVLFNWLLLVILLATAAILYGAIILKFTKIGF